MMSSSVQARDLLMQRIQATSRRWSTKCQWSKLETGEYGSHKAWSFSFPSAGICSEHTHGVAAWFCQCCVHVVFVRSASIPKIALTVMLKVFWHLFPHKAIKIVTSLVTSRIASPWLNYYTVKRRQGMSTGMSTGMATDVSSKQVKGKRLKKFLGKNVRLIILVVVTIRSIRFIWRKLEHFRFM